ncbi:MAG: hypothetical protein WCS03_18260 [Bacteroidota bacterium]
MKKLTVLISILFIAFCNYPLSAQQKKADNANKSKATMVLPDTIKLDTIGLVSAAISKAIRKGGLFEMEKYAPSKIKLTKENPLKVNLTFKQGISYQAIDSIRTMTLSIADNSAFNCGKFAFTSDVAGTTLSMDKNGFVDFSSIKTTGSKISQGEVTFQGEFTLNKMSCHFESGVLIFEDNVLPGQYSEGTVFSFNGRNYIYANKLWVKTN